MTRWQVDTSLVVGRLGQTRFAVAWKKDNVNCLPWNHKRRGGGALENWWRSARLSRVTRLSKLHVPYSRVEYGRWAFPGKNSRGPIIRDWISLYGRPFVKMRVMKSRQFLDLSNIVCSHIRSSDSWQLATADKRKRHSMWVPGVINGAILQVTS